MGQAKNKQRTVFSADLIEEWESDDCVNFAVALARLTGWLLHVDWWSTSTEQRRDIPLDELTPLRVYAADNDDRIFDVRGVRSIVDFNERVLSKVIQGKGFRVGGVCTRFYGEAKLSSLPLRSQPDEAKIARATEAIRANPSYLALVPVRTPPYIPADKAAEFTFGYCAAYAEAMRELTGLQPAALLAIRFLPQFEGTQHGENGYFHSVVLHQDGSAEDVWGRGSAEEIARRFGVIEFKVSSEEHRRIIEKIRQSTAERYEAVLTDAKNLIKAHRLGQ